MSNCSSNHSNHAIGVLAAALKQDVADFLWFLPQYWVMLFVY